MEFVLIFLFMFIFSIGIYVLFSYVLFRIGKKFGVGTFPSYLIPIYNLYLLTKCAGIPANYLLFLLIPIAGPLILGVILYGSIAQQLNKDYWLYGIGTALLGFPAFILAFDSSLPNPTDSAQIPILFDNQNLNQPSNQNSLPSTGITPYLLGTGPDYSGAAIQIPDVGIVVGRDPNVANIILNDANISKAHARIALNPLNNSVIVEDLDSTNGTFINQVNSPNWTPVYGSLEVEQNVKIRFGTNGEIFEITF